MWAVSIQRVKLQPIKYSYKLMRGHWTRETTYVSEMQRCFILYPSLHFYLHQIWGNIRGKHKTICWAAEIIITWNAGMILLLSSSEETLMCLFISFVLRNIEIHQVQ